jgi:ubiquinone/menaquinone biosynthesis C-methylase UbiE
MKLGRIEKWFMMRPHRAEHVINVAEKLLSSVNVKEKQTFLEIGCGIGAVSKHMTRRHRLDVTGTDVDPEMVRFAQENVEDISDIRFLEADATNLPFQDDYFEIVLSFGVMHHISNWLDALREMSRVLKLKGYFIYFDLVFPELLAKVGRLFSHSYGITTVHDLRSFFGENSFSVIHLSSSRGLFGSQYEAVYQKT